MRFAWLIPRHNGALQQLLRFHRVAQQPTEARSLRCQANQSAAAGCFHVLTSIESYVTDVTLTLTCDARQISMRAAP
jgi:hypothetical protein